MFEDAGVRRGVRCGGRAERLLVDDDQLAQVLQAEQFVVRTGLSRQPVQLARDRAGQRVVDQRTLARSTDTRDGGQRAEWNPQVDIPQVVLPGTEQFEPAAAGRGKGRGLRGKGRNRLSAEC